MPSYSSWTEFLEPQLVLSKIHAISHKRDNWIDRVSLVEVNPLADVGISLSSLLSSTRALLHKYGREQGISCLPSLSPDIWCRNIY